MFFFYLPGEGPYHWCSGVTPDPELRNYYWQGTRDHTGCQGLSDKFNFSPFHRQGSWYMSAEPPYLSSSTQTLSVLILSSPFSMYLQILCDLLLTECSKISFCSETSLCLCPSCCLSHFMGVTHLSVFHKLSEYNCDGVTVLIQPLLIFWILFVLNKMHSFWTMTHVQCLNVWLLSVHSEPEECIQNSEEVHD